MNHEYHIALSFAGEERAYIDDIAKMLDSHGVKIFYDSFEESYPFTAHK